VRSFSFLAASLALAGALVAAGPSSALSEGGSRRALVVVIDPGHGGAHPHEGARGPNKLYEKTVSLLIAKKLKALLELEGATAILTREDDIDLPLSARAAIANEADADLFVSIHCNSMATVEGRRVTHGVETYFLSPDPTDAEARLLAEMENGGPDSMPAPRTADPVKGLLADLTLGQARNDSAQLAELVQRSLVRSLRAASRGVRQAPFLVLSALKMPAVLVETGFISHPVEGRRLGKEAYQSKIADALFVSVKTYAEQVLARRLDSPANVASNQDALAAGPAKALQAKAREPAAREAEATIPAKAILPAGGAATVPAVAGLPATR